MIQTVKYWECVIIQKQEKVSAGWDTQYPICQINTGVITRNKRSIKLINRLSFKTTGNCQTMEINRKVEQLELYNLINPEK